MRSAFLEGLSREPIGSVQQQIVAWDDSDVVIRTLAKIKEKGGDLLSQEAKDLVRMFFENASAKLGGPEGSGITFEDRWDLPLMKFSKLCDHVGERIDEPPGVAYFEYLSNRIENHVVRKLLEEDDRSLVGKLRGEQRQGFSGTTIEDATKYVVTKLFVQIQEQFEGLPIEERRKAADKILKAIDTLDVETQAELRQRLDIERLGVDALLKSGAIASLGTGFGAVIAIGGFGSYTLLTSTIASVAGIFGFALPFKFYIVATSGLALISNPLVLTAMAAGGGYLLRKKANKSVRDRYANILVAFSVIGQGNETTDPDPVKTLVDHARRRFVEFSQSTGGSRSAFEKAFPAFGVKK